MKEWGVPFHTIEREWTDPQFFLMLEKRSERIERENKAHKKASSNSPSHSDSGTTRRTSYTQEQAQMFAQEVNRKATVQGTG